MLKQIIGCVAKVTSTPAACCIFQLRTFLWWREVLFFGNVKGSQCSLVFCVNGR